MHMYIHAHTHYIQHTQTPNLHKNMQHRRRRRHQHQHQHQHHHVIQTDRQTHRSRDRNRTGRSIAHQSSFAYLANALTKGLHAATAVELDDFMTVLVGSLTEGNIIWPTSQVVLGVHICTSPYQAPVYTEYGEALLIYLFMYF